MISVLLSCLSVLYLHVRGIIGRSTVIIAVLIEHSSGLVVNLFLVAYVH